MTDRIESSEIVETAGGRQYHIGLAPGEVAEYMILVGDPERARTVAGLFESVELERSNREYLSFTGLHEGLRVTVMGTGMGTGNTEIAVVELCQCFPDGNLPTMIRCGSTGALQHDMQLGDLVISKGALRMENTSTFFVDEGFPALADAEVQLALIRAADEASLPHHVGVTATAAGFYGAQGRHVPGFPPRRTDVVDDLARQGVTNLEMETSCLLTMATFRGFRAGAVCAVYATRRAGEFIGPDAKVTAERNCIDTGLRALHHVHEMDAQRGERRHWHPGLASE